MKIALFALPISAFALFGFTDQQLNNRYLEILDLQKIQGKPQAAQELARETLQRTPRSHRLYAQLSDVAFAQDEKSKDKAIRFLTGTKTEVYCKNLGLVAMDAQHDDGTQSSLRLLDYKIQHNSNSYAIRKAGNVTYALANGYRPAQNSNVSILSGDSNHASLYEIRRNEGREADTGNYRIQFSGKNSKWSFQTHGESLEPFPMYMATDFQIWGSPDFGLQLKFKDGFTDTQKQNEEGNGVKVRLLSTRKVAEHLPRYSFTANNGNYEFEDCYAVDIKISLEGVERSRSN